jgi:hypothetical protein
MRTSLRFIAATFALALGLAALPSATAAQSASDIHGGWIIAEWEAPAGQEGPVPQRGLFIFSESGHYSIMFVIGEGREAVPDSPTDADIAAAYGPFVANSGRYSVEGNTITYEAFVAKDPAYMSRFAPTGGEGNEQTITFERDGDALIFSFGDGGPMGGSKATLRRPGGGD